MRLIRDGHDGGPSNPAPSTPAPGERAGFQPFEVHYPTLHLIRALMAQAVFTSHWSVPRYGTLMPQTQLLIDVFFSVEGFLAGSLAFSSDGSPGGWAPVIRRFTAIYPLYLIGLIAGLLALYPSALQAQDGWSLPLFGAAAVRGLLMLPTFSQASAGAVYPFNAPSWAIVLETATFAVFWPLRARLNVKVLALATFAAMAVTLGLAIKWHDLNMGWEVSGYWGGFPRTVFGFLSGALLFKIMQSTGPVLPRLNPLLICLVSVAILFPRVHFIGLFFLLVVVPLLTWTGATSAEPKWLASVGRQADRHAYALYLLAFPTVVAWRQIGASLGISETWLSGPASFPAMLCAALLAAHLGTIADEHIRRGFGAAAWQRAGAVAARG